MCKAEFETKGRSDIRLQRILMNGLLAKLANLKARVFADGSTAEAVPVPEHEISGAVFLGGVCVYTNFDDGNSSDVQ